MIEIKLDNQQVTAAIRQINETLGNPAPVYRDIGELLLVSTKRRFADKLAPDGSRWAANSAITQARKGGNDPLIGESKRLGREIYYRVEGQQLIIGSPLEYAAVQHFGARKGQFGKSKRNGPLPWGRIPPRPFLGVSAKDQADIFDIIKEHLLAAK